MEKSCGNLYILPTVHRDSDLRYQLVDITDLQDYCEHLSQLSDCIVAIAVKNTLGKKLCEPEMAALKKIGVALDLQGRLRKGYAFVSDNSIKVMEKLGGVDEDVCFNQYVGEYHFRVESNPFNSSNSVSIQIDEKEYSTNLTGLNFVVWDKKEGKLIDSCCFDTNVADVSCTRKILFT
jgi:hypothetical protein